jgi:hypothetical protein
LRCLPIQWIIPMAESTSDDRDTPVWGVRAISEIIGKSQASTYHLLARQHLDADKLGHQWVTTRRRLLRRFAGDSY